jgi:hypothetical protein
MTLTDPARELAELCHALTGANQQAVGYTALAAMFDVQPWSPDFYQIVFTIGRRIEALRVIVSELSELDDELKGLALAHLDQIAGAFGQGGVSSTWSHAVTNHLSPAHVGPIRMLSPLVSKVQTYPKLDAEERAELLAVVDELLGWLRDHQLKEQDFIRQAIIEGLEGFKFRAERVQWLGWGYTLESLREVIGAYLALERGLDPNKSPDAGALLMKLATGVQAIFKAMGTVKDAADKTQWMLETYKTLSALAVAHKGVTLLLPWLPG